MKSIKSILLFIFLLFLLAGCEGSLDDEKLESNEAVIERYLSSNNLSFTKQNGIYHAVRLKGVGYHVNEGDSIAFWYIGYTLDGNIFDTNIFELSDSLGFDTSINDFKPIKTVAGSSNFLDGINRGLLLCREGELGTILFPSIYGFGEKIVESIPAWSSLAYDIFIIYVKNQEIEQEQNIISNFVAGSLDFSQDTTGLWFSYIDQNEQEIKPTLGDTIYGWFKGTDLNNNLIEELPIEGQQIILGEDNLIEGVEYGFLMMYEGEMIQLVVPSSLGYGIQGSENVEPYTPLLYELRLDSIK
jgi:FKBP-type peptidyl-prolyl cis-trans isomerase